VLRANPSHETSRPRAAGTRRPDDHVKRRLVRAMYPRDKVPEEVVVPLLSVLSSTTSLSIKARRALGP